MQGRNQCVDFLARVIERHRGARRCWNLEEVHHRHRAMVTRANRYAFGIENRADVMWMHPVECERHDRRFTRRGTDEMQSRHFD